MYISAICYQPPHNLCQHYQIQLVPVDFMALINYYYCTWLLESGFCSGSQVKSIFARMQDENMHHFCLKKGSACCS